MASFAQYKAEMDKKYGTVTKVPEIEIPKSTSSSSPAVSGSKSKFAQYKAEMDRKYGSAADVDEDYINTFLQDADSFMRSAQSAYQGMNWRNAASVYEANRSTASDLRKRRSVIEQYLENNKGYVGLEWYNSFKSYLKDFDMASSGYVNAFQDKNRFLSQFETQKDYDDHVAYWTDYEEKKNFDLEAGQQEIRELENLLKEYELLVKWGVDGKGRERAQQIRSQYGGRKGIKDTISQKTAYLNQARRIQNGEKLAGAAGNADFGRFSAYSGNTAYDPEKTGIGARDEQYEWINDRNGFRQAWDMAYTQSQLSHAAQSGAYGNPGESEYRRLGYDQLKENEIAIYNYYYAKEGKEKAQEYLDSIQEVLNRRMATGAFETLEGNTALELVFGARAGLDQFESGMKNLFNDEDDYIAHSAFQIASGMVRGDLADNGPKLPEVLGGASLGQMAYDTINTSANMAPSILGSIAANMILPGSGAYVGSALMGASAAGNAYQEALNEGYSKDQAKGYGLLVGASEIVMEKVLGGISAFGGNALGKFLTKNLSNADTALKMIAKRLGGSMISEFSEEYLQEVLTPVFQNMMLGTDNEVKLISPEALYSGMLGALTAGVMEGPGIVGGEVSTHNTGRRLQDAGVSAERLAEIGKTFAADTVAYQLAGKVNANTGAYTMGRLFNEIGAALTEQNVRDITNALEKKGMDRKTAEANARAMAAVVEGANFTDTDVAIIEANDILAEAVRTTIIDQNATWYQRTNGYNEALMALAQETADTERPRKGRPWKRRSGKNREADADLDEDFGEDLDGDFNPEENPGASDDLEIQQELEKLHSLQEQSDALEKKLSEAYRNDNYEEAERIGAESASIYEQITAAEGKIRELRAAKAEGVQAQSEADSERNSEADGSASKAMRISAINNGVATIKMADGSEVSAKEADLDPDEGVRIENIASIEGISAEDANFILNTLKVSPGASAQMDSLGAKEAYKYGFYGFSLDHIAKHGVFANSLNESQRLAIYQTGQKARQTQVAAKQVAVSQKETTTQKVSGKVHFDGDRSTLTERQNASLSVLETVADVLGVQIHVFESELNERGKRIGANGWYDSKDNSIHIDLHAGANGEGTMLFTAAHELTHHIRKWSPAKFKTLADFLMQEYGKKGVNVDALVREQMAKAKRNGRNISYDTAYEEVVADSMETMLADGKVMEKLAKLKQQDRALWQKIKDFISELAAKIRSVYEGLSPDSAEGRYVAEMKDSIEKLQELFTEALVEAGENYQAAQEGVDAGAEMSNEEAFFDSKTAVLYQIRPPYSDGSKAFNTFADGLNPEARKTFELFYGFYQKSRIENALSVSGKKVRKVNISSLYLLAQDWNAMLEKEPKWAQAAKELAQFLPADIRRRMNMNENGTLNPSTMEQEFKMPSSLAQRLVDALPYESIEAKYQLGGKEITLPEGKARQSVGGEAYRRAILQETRMLYEQGKLRPVGIGTMSKDRWGSLGFLAANGKTKASGDFTTVCPQMMFNRGCWYCYRRAAMEKGVNNKLVAQNVWYTGEILRIKDSDVAELNKNGGLRIQSFGDWMPHFSAMLADVLYDAELRGLQVKIITKEPGMINYIAALRDQGIGKNLYFNLSADYTIERGPAKQAKGADSLDAVNPERPYMRDQDNAFWWKRAMSVEEASRYREKYPWVNTRIVATDVEEFIRGLRDSRVDVVTGYHGNIRGIERVDSTTGARKIEVEALGDAGMPRFAFNPVSGQWVVEYEGKTATHKKLAQAIAENGLQMEYYTKTCCITGRCATCYGKCGAIARDFNVKNATNRDGQSVAYWQRQMEYAIEPEFGDMTGENADEVAKNTEIAQSSEVKHSNRDAHKVLYSDRIIELTEDEVYELIENSNHEGGQINADRIIADIRHYYQTGETRKPSLVAQFRYSLRDPDSVSNRSLLANAFEGVAQNEIERNKIQEYKGKIDLINAEERKLQGLNQQIRDMSFAKGPKDTAKIRELQFEAQQTANRINTYDRQLLRLEASKPLQDVLDREKKMAYQRAEKKGKEALEAYRLKAEVKQSETLRDYRETRAAIRQQKSEAAVMEKEFIRIVKAYEKLDAKTTAKSSKDAQTIADLKAKLKDEARRHKDDQKTWEAEFNRLVREYEASGRSIAKLEEKIEQQKSEAAVMEKEFIRIVKAYEKLDAKTTAKSSKDAQTIADLKAKLKDEARRHKDDQKTWEAEFNRLVREYEASGRSIAKLEEKIEQQKQSAKAKVEGRKKTAMRHKIKDVVHELNEYLLKGSKDKRVMVGLQKAVAEALDAVNMDTVGAEERIAKLEAELLKAKTPEKIQEISRKIDRIRQMGDRMSNRLKALKDAYREIAESDDPLIANAHDDVIEAKLESVIETVGNTPLRDMTLEQLEEVYDMYRMVLTTIRNANKAFKTAKSESISVLANQVMEEVEKVGGKRKYSPAVLEAIKKFGWNNLKPVYAFKHIGSDTFARVFDNVRAGEDVWALDVTEAREFYLDRSGKFGYDRWNFDKRYTFTSSSGMDFSLNLEQIMSLYAYSKRDQAAEHLKRGGIVIDETTEITMKTKLGIPVKFNPTEATAYNISDETLAEIIGKLTDDQKGFVDEMQEYLSTVMGAKGNEVSLELYGIKLFKEKFYFPLKSASQFMAKAKEQQQGEVKIKNSGFSKETVKKASNPIVLTPFMNVWSNHVNEMSMYHAFVLPMEDFYRVYNYRTPTSDSMATESVEMFIQNAYGKGATGYIDRLLKDLNGGARTDSTTGIINKGMGLFKKGAVFASMSVVVQQPSAIARAAALVDIRHFIGPKVDHKRHKLLWKEVKRYAPVAIIKEMGYFDTNMGKSTQDFILGKEYSGISEKMKALVTDSGYRDEVLSKAPALADELAWCSIWEAVKRETRAKNPGMQVTSEEFLEMCGERFTEVIVKTQVYDSVLSRSANMRSKDTGMKMATAFMAEPTTSINMVADALLQGKRGNRKYARAAIGAVIASNILNSILVSFVYAGRDDDEDETYLEKYIGTLSGEIVDSLNPAGYIPFIKDIQSIVQGYDVERSDMAVISDLWNAYQNLSKDSVSTYRKVEGFVGSICQIFGLPVKNIMRDVRGIYQTIMSFRSGQQTTKAGIGYAVKSAISGEDVTDQQQLYEAILSGDKTQIARVTGRFKDQSAINSAIRKALRENDPRIAQAAQAKFNGDLDEYMRLAKAIIAEKHFSQDDVVAAINAEINALDKGETTTSAPKASGLFKAADFAAAIAQGDQAMANAIRTDIISTAQRNGKTKDEAEKSFTSSVKSDMKELFMEGKISWEKAVGALMTYCDMEQEGAERVVGEWEFQTEYGFAYDERIKQFKNGNISASELKSVIMSVEGKDEDEANTAIARYSTEAYEEGFFSRNEAASIMTAYGGLTASEAEADLQYIDVKLQFPDTYVDDAWVDEYYSEVQSSGISIETFIDYRSKVKGIDGKGKKEGRMAVIDSMPISNAQKDALYYAEGWAASRIYEAPWR